MPKPPKKYTKNNKFWVVWSKCKKQLSAAEMTDSEIEEERQAILKSSGAKPDKNGRYSMTSLTNSQFNTALDFMEVTILGMPNKKRRSKSKIYAIEQLGIDDSDLNEVSQDTWKNSDWRTLTIDQLTKFQMTAKRIASQLKKAAQS